MTKSQPLKWHGGKSYLAKWIISNFPSRDIYTHYNEAFAGGLSVLFAHDPTNKSESVNDLNKELTNFWNVLREYPATFYNYLELTPLSQIDWEAVKENTDSNIWRAVRFFIKYRQSRQGLGKDYATPTTRTRRGMNENVSAWLSAIDGLREAHERLIRVEIRNMPAIEFIKQYDHPKALFYLDPPYLHSTRSSRNEYECEMTEFDHLELLNTLYTIEGKFILSGYDNELYNFWYKPKFRRVQIEIDNKASSAKIKETKVECLWMNY